jgi:DNA replication protein DnaC
VEEFKVAIRGGIEVAIRDHVGQRATIITHQLPIEHWHAWLGDPTIADAILDRLMQNCRRFHLEGESRRTRGAAARAAGKPQKEKEDQKI